MRKSSQHFLLNRVQQGFCVKQRSLQSLLHGMLIAPNNFINVILCLNYVMKARVGYEYKIAKSKLR